MTPNPPSLCLILTFDRASSTRLGDRAEVRGE